MKQQPPQRSVLHQFLSVLSRKVPGQAKQPIQPPQRPAPGNREAWRSYWKAQGQPWRTEPEIDGVRQAELAQRRDIVPDMEKGIYPFKGVKLSRADIEWLLATHESGRGPIGWNEEQQREREGLDMRGADLRSTDLTYLPLACLRGGLSEIPWASLENWGPCFESKETQQQYISKKLTLKVRIWREPNLMLHI